MVAIINYGLGNLGSIANMLKVIGAKSIITDDARIIQNADKIILPGVGAFDAGMSKLQERNLADVLRSEAESGKPVLGICLGMQLLGRRSEEGKLSGLNLIPFDNIRFKLLESSGLKVPHMGWDIVHFQQENILLKDIQGVQRYYFVHSYHAKCDSSENILMTCNYGYEFAAAVVKDSIFGVQFHPEKSHDFGMRLLDNFVRRC